MRLAFELKQGKQTREDGIGVLPLGPAPPPIVLDLPCRDTMIVDWRDTMIGSGCNWFGSEGLLSSSANCAAEQPEPDTEHFRQSM